MGFELLTHDQLEMLKHLAGALLAGGLIGLERSYHGRPAGFRTHVLVCLASAMLMLVTLYQSHWFQQVGLERITIDPTRMAQGIMTGIGFLGAGVIMKEGLSVRGLTTAGSIWVTAAIGILIGIGFYFAAAVSTVLVLGTLSVFRWIEARIPMLYYALLIIRFQRENAPAEDRLRELVARHGFTAANLTYRLINDGKQFEYRMYIRSATAIGAATLATELRNAPDVVEFRLSPTGD
jgi:putative Mg2+ transporter-C (MgtC) family protein